MDWVVLGAVVGGVAFVVAIVSVALTVAIMRRRVESSAPVAPAPVGQPTEQGAPLLVPPRADGKQAVFETAQMWGPFPRRRTPTAPPHHNARIWLVPDAALEERTTDEIVVLGRAETTADVAHAKTDTHVTQPPKTASAELRDMRSALDEFVLTLDDNAAFRPAT